MKHHQVPTIIPILDKEGFILMPFSIPMAGTLAPIFLRFEKQEADELADRIKRLTTTKGA